MAWCIWVFNTQLPENGWGVIQVSYRHLACTQHWPDIATRVKPQKSYKYPHQSMGRLCPCLSQNGMFWKMEVTLLQNFLAYAKSVLGLGPKQQLLHSTAHECSEILASYFTSANNGALRRKICHSTSHWIMNAKQIMNALPSESHWGSSAVSFLGRCLRCYITHYAEPKQDWNLGCAAFFLCVILAHNQ